MNGSERTVWGEVVVPASPEAVWEAWTTEEGARSFFAPHCHIELRVDGAYEMYFDLDAEPGKQGGEEMRILAIQQGKMLSFTWNAPPTLPTVRGQRTHVVVHLYPTADGQTRVTLRHDGFGEGGEWDPAYGYFLRAWPKVVLPRLVYSFAYGPLDWDHLPQFEGSASEQSAVG